MLWWDALWSGGDLTHTQAASSPNGLDFSPRAHRQQLPLGGMGRAYPELGSPVLRQCAEGWHLGSALVTGRKLQAGVVSSMYTLQIKPTRPTF